jgi:hypothetical protein
MKKRKLKGRNEMTNKEFVKLLDEIWHMVQKRRRANSRNLSRKVAGSQFEKKEHK